MTEKERILFDKMIRPELVKIGCHPADLPAEVEADDIPEPNLPPIEPDSPFAESWELYRKEFKQLIRAGHRGKYAVVRAGHETSVWDTLQDALRAARLLYGSAPCVVVLIDPHRATLRTGFNRLCRD